MAEKKVRAVPEELSAITPHLIVSDGAKAIDFYKRAFGAEEQMRMPAPDGKSIWHARLRIGNAVFFLNDEAPAMGNKSAKTLGGTPVTLQLNVEDADATWKRAVGAGATSTMPLADMFWGDRYGQVTDPFGNRWAICTHVKDLSPEELKKASAEAAKQFAKK